MRLNKFLAKSGLASRRKCDKLIEQGLISINDKIIKDYSYQVQKTDHITCNNNHIENNFSPIIYIFNKPKGVISTVNDPQNRKTVLDYFNTTDRLFPIGRLDRDTTGVLLVTNDGDIAYRLTHPKFGIERKYIVETKIPISKNKLLELSKGITLDNNKIARGKIKFIDKKFNRFIYEIILKEGKNREVKRIIQYFDSKVESLHRFSFAGLTLGKLKSGYSKKISYNYIKSIINSKK